MTVLFEMDVRVGGDPRRFVEFAALCDELAKLNHAACPDMDWAGVEQLCLTLFRLNGADLQSVAALGLVHLETSTQLENFHQCLSQYTVQRRISLVRI